MAKSTTSPINGALGGRPVSCPHIFWAVLPVDQGQIVSRSYPQVAGSAEGESGPANGLSLVSDASDRSWRLSFRGAQIAAGTRNCPSPELAMHIAGIRAGIYRAYDSTTEWMGPVRSSVEAAAADAQRHNAGCAKQGGYGSAVVVMRDGARSQTLAGETVWPPHGRSTGAVRWA